MDDTKVPHVRGGDHEVCWPTAERRADLSHVPHQRKRSQPQNDGHEGETRKQVQHLGDAGPVPVWAPRLRDGLQLPNERLHWPWHEGREEHPLHVEHKRQGRGVQHQVLDVRRGGEPHRPLHEQSDCKAGAHQHHNSHEEEPFGADGNQVQFAVLLAKVRAVPGSLVDGLEETHGVHQLLVDVEEPHKEHHKTQSRAWWHYGPPISKVVVHSLLETCLSGGEAQGAVPATDTACQRGARATDV
mmetsp:Transcript_150612/g.419839  ORF Transcript_150612/g.419839 Transcript_150612/m.419839 type:complete len:243 (+) Transcript_150612:1018-1746(+)